jgi:hypothetical protein
MTGRLRFSSGEEAHPSHARPDLASIDSYARDYASRTFLGCKTSTPPEANPAVTGTAPRRDAQPEMPTTTHRIAQTSTEAKRQHKRNGPGIPERQQKQLQRAYDLEQRAVRLRDAENRRKVAKKKREEKEEHQRRLREQQGVGEATQAIGYNHTQARTKNWMESFLGVDKKKEEARRKKERELTEKLEEIAMDIEKEPWDDDDEAEDIALHLPDLHAQTSETLIDDGLDDDSILEAHDLAMSDPVDVTSDNAPPLPALNLPIAVNLPKQPPVYEDAAFVREHGHINRIVENVLSKLPEALVELLSQDLSMRQPDWNPSLRLLHKLNPTGMPPHRLRIKVGCVVMLLRDLNTSSQLSKSQHLRVLRVENERLECLVLDGQLEGTKSFLTRVPFFAKYKNQDQHLFRRTQFPIRVATDYTLPALPRETSQSSFKIPSIPGRVPPASLTRKPTPPLPKANSVANPNPSFKLPGLPASKASSVEPPKSKPANDHTPSTHVSVTDGWDDFLESGTQIARELSAEVAQPTLRSSSAPVTASRSMVDCLPPLSTQDLDFSLDDLEEESPISAPKNEQSPKEPDRQVATKNPPQPPQSVITTSKLEANSTISKVDSMLPTASSIVKKLAAKSHTAAPPIDLSTLRASQKPPSVSDRPGLKRKTFIAPPMTGSKRQCPSLLRAALPATQASAAKPYDPLPDFMMSTQDVASFFDDDDSIFGSPPIPA